MCAEKNKKPKKPWSGRFIEETDSFVEQFTQSVSYDQRLARYDIMGSIAHVKMLAKVGIVPAKECKLIVQGLEQIGADIEANKMRWSSSLEDVHMNIEAELVQRIGNVGKKLHTGRSRNDQIATDMRLYLRDEIDIVNEQIDALIRALLNVAAAHYDAVMPGLTHLQPAQPVTFGHHLLAWSEMLLRDKMRLRDCRKRINFLPLGSAALAGTSYHIDREYIAELLSFDGVTQNSIDAVSDRDFIIEFCADAGMIMMHLSRFSEELVLWVSPSHGFVELSDHWCTGSSIMPQKKNPDIPELVRGKTGRVYGDLLAILTVMKAQPLAYNRDNQEDKESLFDALDTVKMCLTAYTGLISTMKVNRAAMYQAAAEGYTTATDLADYLVVRGLPFRDAHEIVGKIVRYAMKCGKTLHELTLLELKRFSDAINDDVFTVLELEQSIATRDHIGGTAPKRVKEAIKQMKQRIK